MRGVGQGHGRLGSLRPRVRALGASFLGPVQGVASLLASPTPSHPAFDYCSILLAYKKKIWWFWG